MRRDDLRRLGEAADLVAARALADLAAVQARAAPLRAALAALDAYDPPPPADMREARDRAAWLQWRGEERRRLTMALSRLRAELDGARRASGRAAARAAVVERLAAR